MFTQPTHMMAITIWQPWASLILYGAKSFEFRSYPAPRALRGARIAIHAGARPVRRSECESLLYQLSMGQSKQTGLIPDKANKLLEIALSSPSALPFSSVLCTAVLGEPIRNNELEEALGLPKIQDSDRAEHSNWGWPLNDIIPLEPFLPAKGAQGFWKWRV